MDESYEPPSKDYEAEDQASAQLDSEKWLRKRFRLIDANEFSKEFISRFTAARPHAIDLSSADGKNLVLNIGPSDPLYNELRQELRAQIDELVELSCGAEDVEDSEAARSALTYILSTGGEPVVDDERGTAIGAAARAMNTWSQIPQIRVDGFSKLSWLLAFGGNLQHDLRQRLLDSLELFLKEGGLQAREINECFQNGLKLELQEFSRDSNSKSLVLRWIHLVSRYGPPALCILLDAITDTADDVDIQQAAKAASYALRGSIRRLWEDTPIDQISSVEARAFRLSSAMDKYDDDADLSQYVISQCKGELVADANDPRLNILVEILRRGSERVQLAAARCLTECSMANELLPQTREALHIVADILVNAGDSRYINDAMWIFDNFKTNNPAVCSEVEGALAAATAKFLR